MKLIQLQISTILLGVVFSFQTISPRRVMLNNAPASPTCLYQVSLDDSRESNRIGIEYCTGCRWMLKSFWMAQELLTTFEDDLDAITVIPSDSKGTYAVRLNGNDVLWDRKEESGFPSPKGLKQIVRDLVEPKKFLGHSDTEDRQQKQADDEGEKDAAPREDAVTSVWLDEGEAPHPSVTITYCAGCKWLLRGAYFGQELLTTFSTEIKSVTLVPSKPPAKGGCFVRII
jgi:selenoprotein W-related protein